MNGGAKLRLAPIGIPDGSSAHLEVERSCDAVVRLQPSSGQCLCVAVQVDKTWRDDKAGDIDNGPPLELAFRHREHGPALYADVPMPIEHRLRIDYPPSPQHDVVGGHDGTLVLSYEPAGPG